MKTLLKFLRPVPNNISVECWIIVIWFLGLLFTGSNSFARELERTDAKQPAATNRTGRSLFLVGDSTVHNTSPGMKGWGDVLDGYFDLTTIKVDNRARPGRSSRTFQTEGWWDKLLPELQPGDFLMIQFGHNDASPINDTNRARGTIPGLGEEATNIINQLTHQPEVVHTYGWYMRKYIAEARAKGVTPIICSPVPRLSKQPPNNTEDIKAHTAWARELAADQQALFIDLNRSVLNHFVGIQLAEIKTQYFTTNDNTHFNEAGAKLAAACVVEGLRSLTNCPLTGFLLQK